MRLISVVFGSKSMDDRAKQSRELLAWGFGNFETRQLRPAGQSLATAPVWFGKTETLSVGLANSMTITLPRGQADKATVQLSVNPDLKAPIKKGQVIGQLTASVDGKILAKQPLVALSTIEEAGFFARLMDHIKIFFAGLLG
jgi:D-alanyl-D-alanine carboxypeptidase (penicillin-binding protein 5/6)